jgi:hypothetical protein
MSQLFCKLVKSLRDRCKRDFSTKSLLLLFSIFWEKYMKFQVKALVVALAMAATLPAQAQLNKGDSSSAGIGELFLNVYDVVSQESFVYDLTPQAGFGSFELDNFLPTGVPSTNAGYNAPGAADAKGIDLTWSLANDSAFAAFSAANNNSANWKWNVVALDSIQTGRGVVQDGQRYLTTLEAGSPTLVEPNAVFNGLKTVNTTVDYVNGLAPGVDDPSAYLSNSTISTGYLGFTGSFGDTWLTALQASSTNTVGTSAEFFYITGNPNGNDALVTQYGNDAKFTFNYVNGAASLNYMTAAVPEPETYAMLLAGLGLMGFSARRRNAK